MKQQSWLFFFARKQHQSPQDQFQFETGFLPMSENSTLCLYLRPNSWTIYQNTSVPPATSQPSHFLAIHVSDLWAPLRSQSVSFFSRRPAGALRLPQRCTFRFEVSHKRSDLTTFEVKSQLLGQDKPSDRYAVWYLGRHFFWKLFHVSCFFN